MIIGILKEIKADENRVAVTPAGVEVICRRGHEVIVESDAGAAIGFHDSDYAAAGARVAASPREIFETSEMLARVKEPQPSEFKYLRPGQIYFAFLHLATSRSLTTALVEAGTVNIAYETIQLPNGSLPLLTPMSEVAGKMAIHEGAKYLEMAHGGHGILLGGVPGVDPGNVVILGGGVVGINAAKMACGLGANVWVLDIDAERLRYLADVMPGNCTVLMSSPATIRDLASKADVVVGAVLVTGGKVPILVPRELLGAMKTGTVLIDVAIDQGGCFESSVETTHSDPIRIVGGIVHYAVNNMPGALPRTSTIALTNASLPYILEIADKGWERAMRENAAIRRGANVVRGRVAHEGVAEALGVELTPIDDIL